MQPRKSYKQIDHTADIGIRVWGKDQKQLFAHAATAMFDILVRRKRRGQKNPRRLCRSIKLHADTPEELLQSWLSELLFLYETKRLVFTAFNIETITSTALQAKVCAEPLNLNSHEIKTEIKAVTYHQLQINQKKKKIIAEIIFDV